jgi:hypothetical protein
MPADKQGVIPDTLTCTRASHLSISHLSRVSIQLPCRPFSLLSYFEYSMKFKSIRSPKKTLAIESLLQTSAYFSAQILSQFLLYAICEIITSSPRKLRQAS